MRLVNALALAAISFCCLGCGNGDISQYTPSHTTARESLESAMNAWRGGEAPRKVAETSTSVEFVDSKRQPGQKLVSYEILDALPGDNPNRFSVRLLLDNPQQEIQVQYVVVGNDPIWVFREEDYERHQGM
jgi:hypothetical protein